jgi:hypothetical protein
MHIHYYYLNKFSDFATFVISVSWLCIHGERYQIYFNITMILGLCPHYTRSFKAWVHFKQEQYPFAL